MLPSLGVIPFDTQPLAGGSFDRTKVAKSAQLSIVRQSLTYMVVVCHACSSGEYLTDVADNEVAVSLTAATPQKPFYGVGNGT